MAGEATTTTQAPAAPVQTQTPASAPQPTVVEKLPADVEAMLERRSQAEREKVKSEMDKLAAEKAKLEAEKAALELRLKTVPQIPATQGTGIPPVTPIDASVLKEVADMAVKSAMASVQPQLEKVAKIESELHMSNMTNYAHSLIQQAQGRIIPAMVMGAITPNCTRETLDIAAQHAKKAFQDVFPNQPAITGTTTPLPPGAIQPPVTPTPSTQPPGTPAAPAGVASAQQPVVPAGLPTPAGVGNPPATVNGLPTADAAGTLSSEARKLSRKDYVAKREQLLAQASELYKAEVGAANPMMQPRARR